MSFGDRDACDTEGADAGVARIATRQHGVVSQAQAIDAGMSRSAISRRVDAGRWVRVLPRVYRIGGAPATGRQGMMAATLWAGDAALLGQPPGGDRAEASAVGRRPRTSWIPDSTDRSPSRRCDSRDERDAHAYRPRRRPRPRRPRARAGGRVAPRPHQSRAHPASSARARRPRASWLRRTSRAGRGWARSASLRQCPGSAAASLADAGRPSSTSHPVRGPRYHAVSTRDAGFACCRASTGSVAHPRPVGKG